MERGVEGGGEGRRRVVGSGDGRGRREVFEKGRRDGRGGRGR